MKFTKIISMVLVFAMMLTMFAFVSVFATDNANIVYKVYDESGKEVQGNLVADTVYELSIQFTDIPSKSFKGAEVKTTFDPEVIKLVNKANGSDAGTAAQAFINTLEMYNADSGEGYFKTASLSKGDNYIVYNVSLTNDDGGDILATYENGYPNDGSVELCRIKIKTIGNGSAKIATTADDVKFYPTSEKAAVTIVPNSIRVGDVAYVAATVDESFEASKTYYIGKTTKDDVKADLAKDYASVEVTFEDEEKVASEPVACAITWSEPTDFDASKAGTYTFKGAVTAPESINYKGEAIEVTASVVIETLKVTGVTVIADEELRKGIDTYTLPETVEVTVTGGEKVELAATWNHASVDNTTKGETTYTATIAGTADITVPDDKNTVSFKVTVLEESTNTAPAAAEIDVVSFNSDVDAKEIKLPKFVTLDDGYITVDKWEIKTVNGEAAPADYVPAKDDVITYAPKFAEGFTAPADFIATVTVVVPAGKKADPTFVTTGVASAKNDVNYALADAVKDAGFAADKKISEYADKTPIMGSEIDWDEYTTPAYNNEEPGDYVLKGTWSDIYGHGPVAFEITITIEQAGAKDFYFTLNKYSKKEIKSKVYMQAGTFDDVYVIFDPEDADDEIVEWKSSNEKRAIVEKKDATSARVKARQNVGLVVITAKTKSGIEKSFQVVVEAAPTEESGYVSGNKGSYSILAQAVEEIDGQNAAQNSIFGDLAGYEWAATQIDTLRLLGIVSGKSASTYAPADSVTRAEYLAMLVRLLNLKANGEAKVFTDVNSGDWFYDTVNVASSLGIAYGYENGAFDPNAVIKRQDMAVFAKRAMDVAGLKPMVGVSSTFEDQGDIAPYALESVLFMTSVGTINGMGDGTFKPLETANRAQAAVVIYNIYTAKNN